MIILSSNTKWLTDSIKYAAQCLLKRKCEGKLDGWRSTQCSKQKQLFPPLATGAQYIQILIVDEIQWIVASNIKVHGDGVYKDSVCSTWHTTLSLSTKRQICSFVRPTSNEFKFDIMIIQCQENMNDCGLFAIVCHRASVWRGPMFLSLPNC